MVLHSVLLPLLIDHKNSLVIIVVGKLNISHCFAGAYIKILFVRTILFAPYIVLYTVTYILKVYDHSKTFHKIITSYKFIQNCFMETYVQSLEISGLSKKTKCIQC